MARSESDWVNMAIARLPLNLIKPKLKESPTEELLSFWCKNRRDKFADDLFDAVRDVLQSRDIPLPEQQPFTGKKKGSKTEIGTGIGGLIVYYAYKRLIEEFPDSFILNLLGAIAIGCLFGLVPYFVAKHRGHAKLSKGSLIACAISGAIFGLFGSVPMAVIFTIVTLLQKKTLKQDIAEQTHG